MIDRISLASRRQLLAACTAALVVVGVGATAHAVDRGSPEPTQLADESTYETRTTAVSARELWEANLAALECFEEAGAATSGPIPSADGLNVMYTVQPTEDFDAIDRECTKDLVPISMRFVTDSSSTESTRLLALRTGIESCLANAGIALDSRAPAGANPDGALQEAMASNREAVRECAAQAAVPR